MSVFSDRVSQLMQDKGYSNRTMAVKTGLTESEISRYKNGNRMPKVDNLLLMAYALDVEPEWLIGQKGDNK